MGDPQYMRFPVEEFQMRCNKARELMAEKGLKGLFITEGRNYTYFSGGTRDNSNARPHAMILPLEGDPVAIIQRFPEWNRRKGIWFDDVRIYDTMFGLPLEMTVEVMKEKGMGEGLVGVELGHEQKLGMDTDDFLKLKELLPKVEFVGAADVLWDIRMIKSPEEVARSRRACEITIMAYEALFPGLYEGMMEKEIMNRFLKLQMNMGGSSPWGSMNSGPENYLNNSGGPPTNRRIRKGDQVWLDGGCFSSEYVSDFCCAGTVGPPSDKQKKAQQMMWEITRAVGDAVRPGMRACDIDALNGKEWEKRGYNYNRDINWGGGRIGHGLAWGGVVSEPPHIASYDETVIRPGMIITIEPGINFEYGTYCTETNCLVTEDGLEILNDFNRELRIIPV